MGQYFGEPEIEDEGVGGLWGVFDVSNKPSPIPAFTAAVKGDRDCVYCQVDTPPSLDGLDNAKRFNLTYTTAVRRRTGARRLNHPVCMGQTFPSLIPGNVLPT
ncbi:hypothetical protein AB0L74_29380 [Streptomyces sp. NPDC052020]|uniref:hypothetical protein n=1 Tax=Streptomyces sp. NPDC052020 TaxID=3155677 RepID=UPI00344ABF00